MSWRPFAEGSTLETPGSESGTIVTDEEHSEGARITIERTAYPPFSITCGVYGLGAHTCFAGTEKEARLKCEAMKVVLAGIAALPGQSDPNADLREDPAVKAWVVFVHEF